MAIRNVDVATSPRPGPRWACARRLVLCAVVLASAAGTAWANGRKWVSGPNWEASVDGTNWTQAYAPYPNDITTPRDTLASLMWYWNDATAPTGTDGPNAAQFRIQSNNFNAPAPTGAWIAADDWMELFVNGHLVASYALAEHTSMGQPVPVYVDFSAYVNDVGDNGDPPLNTFEIRAHDGTRDSATDRRNEWVFFDPNTLTSPPTRDPASFFIPTAPTWALLLAGLMALRQVRARRRNPD
jgi:hypothetical protein